MKQNILKIIIIISTLIIIITLGFYFGSKVASKEKKQYLEKEQSFEAIVTKVEDKKMIVEGLKNNEKAFRETQFFLNLTDQTSYNWKNDTINLKNFYNGDKVEVTFKGEPTEIYPMTIKNIISISLLEENKTRRMIKLNNELYYDTKKESKNKNRSEVMDGTIIQTKKNHEIPSENNTSNFGGEVTYQRVGNNIEVNIDNKWIVFKTI